MYSLYFANTSTGVNQANGPIFDSYCCYFCGKKFYDSPTVSGLLECKKHEFSCEVKKAQYPDQKLLQCVHCGTMMSLDPLTHHEVHKCIVIDSSIIPKEEIMSSHNIDLNQEKQWVGLNPISKEAKRDITEYRFDLLVPEFIKELAKLAAHGANKYGESNWKVSRLTGDKSPLNHAQAHLNNYQANHPRDNGTVNDQLVSVAFNCMMEWWYNIHFPIGADNNETSK